MKGDSKWPVRKGRGGCLPGGQSSQWYSMPVVTAIDGASPMYPTELGKASKHWRKT